VTIAGPALSSVIAVTSAVITRCMVPVWVTGKTVWFLANTGHLSDLDKRQGSLQSGAIQIDLTLLLLYMSCSCGHRRYLCAVWAACLYWAVERKLAN